MLTWDDDIIQNTKQKFDELIKKSIWKKRLGAWQVHYFIITLTLIVIYPTTHLKLLIENTEDGAFKNFLGNLIYYMFICGVYGESDKIKDG